MSDTQWPRFEVFHQETPDQPHRHAGSVHAPDGEMALLNARDVFVRRPECFSLWVAPAASIQTWTREHLQDFPPAPEVAPSEAANYLVFAKLEPRGALAYVGQVRGSSEEGALQQARRLCGACAPPALWLVPDEHVTRSDPDQAPELFEPARDKPFRDQAFYHVQTALRRLRREAGL
jgi:ring-1,2-phenylacetyl-CoA epoxidase subunit PaaB